MFLEKSEKLVFDDFLGSYVPETAATYKELQVYVPTRCEPYHETPMQVEPTRCEQSQSHEPTRCEPYHEPSENSNLEKAGGFAKFTTHPFFLGLVGVGFYVNIVYGVIMLVVLLFGVASGFDNLQPKKMQTIPPQPTPTPMQGEQRNVIITNYINVN